MGLDNDLASRIQRLGLEGNFMISLVQVLFKLRPQINGSRNEKSYGEYHHPFKTCFTHARLDWRSMYAENGFDINLGHDEIDQICSRTP